MSTLGDLGDGLRAVSTDLRDAAVDAGSGRQVALSLASMSSAHGWYGLARVISASAEALELAGAQLTAAADETEQALGPLQVVPVRGATSEVSDHLGTALVTLLRCRTTLDGAGSHLDAARQAAERAEIPVLVVHGRTLGETVTRLRQQIEEIRAGVEAEQQAAHQMEGATSAGRRIRPSDAAPGPTVRGPAAKEAVRSPNPRHFLGRITMKSPRKKDNTVILPGTDVQGDMEAIRDGRAPWDPVSQRYETPGGRTYAMKSGGTLFPDSGPGFAHLDRTEYQALQVYIQFAGDQDRAEATMDHNRLLTADARRRAFAVFKHHRSFRGQ